MNQGGKKCDGNLGDILAWLEVPRAQNIEFEGNEELVRQNCILPLFLSETVGQYAF